MNRKEKKDRAVIAICSVVFPALDILREKGNVVCPSNSEAETAIAGCINSNNGRWRKTKPDGGLPELLFSLIRWHGGNGSLWGFPWFADELEREKMDTLAILMRGCHSSASEAWAKAMKKNER